MGKSEIRKRVCEIWPAAFYEERAPPASREAGVVVIDAMQTLKGLNFYGKTFRDLADRMLADLRLFRGASAFVYCFDKYPFVPVAKAIEQNKRVQAGEAPRPTTEFVCGPLDAEVPDEWSRAVHDRHRWIPEIIRLFVKYWATKELEPTVYIDGHYLRPEDLEEDEIAGGSADWDTLELLKVPLKIGGGDNGEKTLVPAFRNDLGEGDFSIPFMLRMLAPHYEMATVLSIDTDLMPILLSAKTEMRVFWRFWPRLSFSANSNGYGRMQGSNAEKWCDIEVLQHNVFTDTRLSSLRDPVLALLVAIAASGGDYVDPIKRVVPQRYIDTLLVNAAYIGDISDDSGRLDPDAFKRLLRCACMQARCGNQSLFQAEKGEDTDFTKAFSLIPSPTDMLHRRKQLQYYMTMIRRSGEDTLALENPRLWGYGRIDRNKPLTRDNIKRLHGTDAPDDLAVS